jgi:hypothetical protein
MAVLCDLGALPMDIGQVKYIYHDTKPASTVDLAPSFWLDLPSRIAALQPHR